MYATSHEQRRAARARELAATLFSEHYEQLRSTARANCGRWADPEDAIQDAIAAFIVSFDPEGGSPALPWLLLALKRLCWASSERRRREARTGEAGSGLGAPAFPQWHELPSTADVVAAAERTEHVNRLHEGMDRLVPEQRRVVSLVALGYSYEEIAALMGLRVKQVDRRLQGARKILRSVIA